MTWIQILQAIISISLIVVILLQNQGSGAGGVFGGGGNVYSTKRGFDKILSNLTIALAVLFFGISLAGLIL